jgi:outer membrane receptor protein involved in Fe transport
MVRQVPGFQLDDSTTATRGFGGASGNLLINDRRPSAKQDLPSTILSRIPASIVERVELVRGQVRGIDLRGQSVMVNIILKGDAPAAVRWEAFVRKSFEHGPLTPSLSVSLSDTWSGIEYNAGFTARKTAFGRFGLDQVFDGNGSLTENRNDSRENRIKFLNTNLGGLRWVGETLVHLNTIFTIDNPEQFLESHRVPVAAGSDPRNESFEDNYYRNKLEVGFDAEREISIDLTGKGIFLFYYQDEDSLQSQRVVNSAGLQTRYRVADKQAVSEEYITRIEFDWTGFENQIVQVNFEGAFNSLDGSLLQTIDTGAGPVIVDVPGANSLVKEVRWDALISDTISLGQIELDFGLGAETSTIKQSGDAEQERNFFFMKPRGSLSFSSRQRHKTRLRLAREVSQLDLNDFVSATVLEDNDLALGNPDLRPETTWIAELGHERRFGRIGAINLTLFHHWIRDVEDLLPLTPTFEAPGNIGSGRRWGVELESTIPLEWLWLTGARLNIKARLQDSTVVDPVTDENRILSATEDGHGPFVFNVDNKYAYDLRFRQDLETMRFAWGINVLNRAERPFYKVNELDVLDEGTSISAFIETTRWFGIKMSINAENITNFSEVRDRKVFSGERDLSPLSFQEVRDRTRGWHAIFTLSGTF